MAEGEAQTRGDYAELQVERHFLDLGYDVLFHRKKIFGVEFDWIFVKEGTRVYVEVKSVRSAPFYLQRWPLKQKNRFLRVAEILAAQHPSEFFLALVDYTDKVHLFKVGSEI